VSEDQVYFTDVIALRAAFAPAFERICFLPLNLQDEALQKLSLCFGDDREVAERLNQMAGILLAMTTYTEAIPSVLPLHKTVNAVQGIEAMPFDKYEFGMTEMKERCLLKGLKVGLEIFTQIVDRLEELSKVRAEVLILFAEALQDPRNPIRREDWN
jgi:hypothetical protein